MKSFGEAEGVMESSANASGKMQDAYDIWLSSIPGKLGKTKESLQELSMDVLDDKAVTIALTLANAFIRIADGAAKLNVLLPSIVAGILSFKNVGRRLVKRCPLMHRRKNCIGVRVLKAADYRCYAFAA